MNKSHVQAIFMKYLHGFVIEMLVCLMTPSDIISIAHLCS